MSWSPEVIAEVCHEANRALTNHTKDVPVQPPWADAPEEMKKSSVEGVKWRLAHPDAPASAQHEEWMRSKIADGWKYGPKKDPEKKEHSALVPYGDLDPKVRSKDALFTAVVKALGLP